MDSVKGVTAHGYYCNCKYNIKVCNNIVFDIVTSYRYATNCIICIMFELFGCCTYGLLTTCCDIV